MTKLPTETLEAMHAALWRDEPDTTINPMQAAWAASPGPELVEALRSAGEKLNTARSLMVASGAWTNPAGYMTDAAMWIERVQTDIRAALTEAGATQ